MKPATMISHQERILRLLVTIESDLSADLSLATLARQGGFAPYHFHRVFRALVGEPVKEHVRRLRIERAAHELMFGARPIIEIALDAGYETHESFTRAFRVAFSSPPSQYRKVHRREAVISSAPNTDAAPAYRPRAGCGRALPAAPRLGRIERLRSLRVGFIRHVGPYEAVTPVFNRLTAWAAARQTARTELMWIGVAHDNPGLTPADKLRFDCCVALNEDIPPAGEIGTRAIGGGLFGTTTHYGAFDHLAETYAWLGRDFMPSAGLVLRSAPAIEIYLNNPETTPHEQLLTDILLPVESTVRSRRSR